MLYYDEDSKFFPGYLVGGEHDPFPTIFEGASWITVADEALSGGRISLLL